MSHLVRSTATTKRRRLATKLTISCLFLVVLPSCGMPHLRKPDKAPALPENFVGETASSENSSQVTVDEFFADPVLLSLIDQALVGNQELKILAQLVQAANNQVLARRGAYLPFFTIGGGIGADKPSLYTRAGAVDNQLSILPGFPGQRFPSPLPDFLTATNLTWQIDIWRQLRNARDAASFRYLGTNDGRNYVITRLVAEIAESYYSLMALDKRLENLDNIIQLQEQSLEFTKSLKEGARGNELAVQRFTAEVRKNQSERLIVKQEIIQVENRINFLAGRFPQRVERPSVDFFNLNLHALGLGVPSQLLQFRPDIRQAEREVAASGLDVKVARARFFPTLIITGNVGYEAFNPRYLVITPESLIGAIAGGMVAPLINKKAIQAEYLTANAKQLQAVYEYQRVILNAFTEVVNNISKVENYGRSVELKKLQMVSLEASVDSASKLFFNARAQYIDVLLAQRDLLDARQILIQTKREQLSAVINTYQALGGGLLRGNTALPPLPGMTVGEVEAPPAAVERQTIPSVDGLPPVEGLPPAQPLPGLNPLPPDQAPPPPEAPPAPAAALPVPAMPTPLGPVSGRPAPVELAPPIGMVTEPDLRIGENG